MARRRMPGRFSRGVSFLGLPRRFKEKQFFPSRRPDSTPDTGPEPAKPEPLSEESELQGRLRRLARRLKPEHNFIRDDFTYAQRVSFGELCTEVYATIAGRDKTIEELTGRHSLYHVPTLERVMEAHTSMPVGAWEIGQHSPGHREYHQSANESCYLCALAILIEKAKAEIAWLREALEKFGVHRFSCGKNGSGSFEHIKCTCGLDDAKGEKPHE